MVGVEMVEEAVEDAKVNAQLNGECLYQPVVGCITLFYYLTLYYVYQ